METAETQSHSKRAEEDGKEAPSPTVDFEYLYLLMEQRQIEFINNNLTSGEGRGIIGLRLSLTSPTDN
ncbi:MAG: hypothetical protein IJ899_17245 [Blautia sp.]|nr:hypothetical protein [Blautia sp.]